MEQSLRRAGLGAALLTAVAMMVFVPAVGANESVDATTTQGTFTPDVESGIPDDQTFAGSNEGRIEVWKRFAFPVRSDDTTAATQVPLPDDVIGSTGFGQKDLVATFGTEKNPAGAFEAGQTVTVSIADGRANSGALANQDRVDVVAARVTGSDKALPRTVSQGIDLLDDVDNANENASFRMVENGAELDADGELTTTFTPTQPGQYAVFAVVHQQGRDGVETGASDPSLSIPDTDVAVDGDVLLVGGDVVSVTNGVADVTVVGGVAGSRTDFEIDATDAFAPSANVSHAVALYDKDTFEDSRFEIGVDESALGPEFDIMDDAVLRHSIGSVNGVADVEDGITINGVDLTDGRIARTVDAGQVVDFVATDLGVESPQRTAIELGGEDNTAIESLDGSVTAASGESPRTTLGVDTFTNFSAGTYQFVTLSKRDDNASVTSAATGTVRLIRPRTSASATLDGQSQVSLALENSRRISLVEITFDDVQSNRRVFAGELTTLPPTTGGVSGLLADLPSGFRFVSGLEIDGPTDESATVRTTVRVPQLNSPNVGAEDLTFAHFEDGAWKTVPTSVVSENGPDAVLEFQTDGFSTFALVLNRTTGGGQGPGQGQGQGQPSRPDPNLDINNAGGSSPVNSPSGQGNQQQAGQPEDQETPESGTSSPETPEGVATTEPTTDDAPVLTNTGAPAEEPGDGPAEEPAGTTTSGDGAGFGPVIAILAMVVGALGTRRFH